MITIVGAGLAGSETAIVLSDILNDCEIRLVEMRPVKQTPVHKTDKPAELVCSNSFKSTKPTSAAGMLKTELEMLNSPLYSYALKCKVEAGGALAVDREIFSNLVEEEINKRKNIIFENREVVSIEEELQNCDYLIIATGPLTSDCLSQEISKLTGEEHLAFYDAAAPIIDSHSINYDIVFSQDRYGEKEERGDYLNCPMNKHEYDVFIQELINSMTIIKKEFESKELFQACQPIEEVARSGKDAPRFGALKPVGLEDPRSGKRPYAVVQLRAENKDKTAYNLVGFQTNLAFSEQTRVFRMIPGLKNADFFRYGVMHRNTFIDAPHLLNYDLSLRSNSKIFIAGQLSGTEGYLEAVRSGHHCAISVACQIKKCEVPQLCKNTVFGALISYSTNPETVDYQPMHVNFGIINPLDEKIKNKSQRYEKYAQRGQIAMQKYVNELVEIGIKI